MSNFHNSSNISSTSGKNPEPFERRKDDPKFPIPDRRAIHMVRNFMDRSSLYREWFLELARRSREAYENWQRQSKSLIQRANLQLPFGYTIIESQLPQLMDVFWKGGNVVQFRGQDFEDAEFENSLTDFLAHQF